MRWRAQAFKVSAAGLDYCAAVRINWHECRPWDVVRAYGAGRKLAAG